MNLDFSKCKTKEDVDKILDKEIKVLETINEHYKKLEKEGVKLNE